MVVVAVVDLLLVEELALEVPVAVAQVLLIRLHQLPALQTRVEAVAVVGRQPLKGELAAPVLSSSNIINLR
jgi:hypothetical protein